MMEQGVSPSQLPGATRSFRPQADGPGKPQILQPLLQELGKQNPQLLGLINRNQGNFFAS